MQRADIARIGSGGNQRTGLRQRFQVLLHDRLTLAARTFSGQAAIGHRQMFQVLQRTERERIGNGKSFPTRPK